MDTYLLKPASQAEISVLIQRLTELKIPFQEVNEKQSRCIRIGPDAEYELRVLLSSKGRVSKANISITYESPVIKGILIDWIDHCGLEVPGDFYKCHIGLSPTILRRIQSVWRIDLIGQAVTPVRFHKYVMIFTFVKNASQWISAQLSDVPHKRMENGEYIRCPEWEVSAADPLDTEVYGWSRDPQTQIFVTEGSAPAVTMLSLWIVPKGAQVDIHLGKMQ